VARRGRELEPAWAEGLSLDEIESEREARALPIDTDPDTVSDPDVRERFLARLHRDDPEEEPARRRTAPAKRHRAQPTSARRGARAAGPAGRGRPRSRSHARGPLGAPTLRPPRSIGSSRDWTGFGFGLLLYALGAAYIRYGPGGPTMWLKAKFVNDVEPPPVDTAQRYARTQQRNLRHLLVPPTQKAPEVAPAPKVMTPPGSLGWLWAQPTAPTAKAKP
jgi:hypothetical protein